MKTYNIILDSSEITCKPNSILSSRIYRYLTLNGHTIGKDFSRADYIIVNTCGFDRVREKISKNLLKHHNAKKKKQAKIISLGCLNKIDKEAIKAVVPDAMFVDDIKELDKVFRTTVAFESLEEACLDPDTVRHLVFDAGRGFNRIEKMYLGAGRIINRLMKPFLGKNTAIKKILEEADKRNKFYVEISRGCVNNCSYCIIKKARGGLQSRRIERIMADIATIHAPARTLCLVADDCGSYGLDIGSSFFGLLAAIRAAYPALMIDICYLNPYWVEKYTAAYIDIFSQGRINSVNISMQSGSDAVVKAMNRTYSVNKVIEAVRELKRVSPQTLIWTHIIAGFPGESEEDFQKTLSILDNFDFSSKFVYADRQGTPSSLMPNKIPEWVKLARKARLEARECTLFCRKFMKWVRGSGPNH